MICWSMVQIKYPCLLPLQNGSTLLITVIFRPQRLHFCTGPTISYYLKLYLTSNNDTLYVVCEICSTIESYSVFSAVQRFHWLQSASCEFSPMIFKILVTSNSSPDVIPYGTWMMRLLQSGCLLRTTSKSYHSKSLVFSKHHLKICVQLILLSNNPS